jgi:hypothetical protein
MDEESIAVRERVERKFVAQALAFGGSVHLWIWRFVMQSGQPQSTAGASDQDFSFFAKCAAHTGCPLGDAYDSLISLWQIQLRGQYIITMHHTSPRGS